MKGDFRIVSLAPTQTEILAALGLADRIVGITENCDYPPEIIGRRTLGTWYAPDLRGVMAARPDLVCTFGAHQVEFAEVLEDAGLTVVHSDPGSVSEALLTIDEMGRLTGCAGTARSLLASLTDRLETVRGKVSPTMRQGNPMKVLRIMNWEPLVTAGPGSFQDDVIRLAGGRNVASDGPAPYFVFTANEAVRWDPEVVFFCEPDIRGLMETHSLWRQTSALRHNRIFVFHCGLTCRSGPRIVDMVEALSQALLSCASL